MAIMGMDSGSSAAGACTFPVWLGGNAGGTTGTGEETPEHTLDTAGFIDAMTDAGASIETGEGVSQGFLSVPGQIIRVNEEDVQVYEYSEPAAAQADASQISPDGSSTATTMITWVATPHFFQAGRLLVLYVGDNDEIVSLLEQILGPQFAGG